MAIESFSEHPKTAPVRPNKRSQQIFEELSRDIVLGLLAPRTGLLELELADRFQCSQSTIREALLRLNEEGLVVRTPHRGTLIADCRRDDMIELIRMRHDIECRGVARAIQHYDRLTHQALCDLFEHMQEAAKKNDKYLLSQLDSQFHLRLYREANLPSIEPVLHRCLVHNHRYKILKSERINPLIVTAERHLPIIEALDSGDLNNAVNALSQHITTGVDLGPNILAASAMVEGSD